MTVRAAGRPPGAGRPAARPRRLPRGARAALLSAHVVASVGWLGLHGGLLTLLAAGLATDDPGRAGALYTAAAVLARTLVLPVSLTAVLTGLALAMGTHWGLLRHTWVAVKLVLSVLLLIGSNLSLGPQVLLLAEGYAGGGEPPDLERVRAVVMFSVALCVLLAATLLSTVKPFGRTPWRRAP
ncbi:hypothetical protein [Nocardiopsis trehalosi]|uniref:hypothetical protein n=1 Tax=Nocardiopsis trehalosi TaxID=109329 RepID=UPI0009FCB009|nr:hypothetical protein [Nocardiopsis trehalosi]